MSKLFEKKLQVIKTDKKGERRQQLKEKWNEQYYPKDDSYVESGFQGRTNKNKTRQQFLLSRYQRLEH